MARVAKYGKKKTREVSVSEDGWLGMLAIASQRECTSVSDLLEQLGRNPGWMQPHPPDPSRIELPCDEQVDAAIAAVLPTIAIKGRAIASRAFKKLAAKLAESAL